MCLIAVVSPLEHDMRTLGEGEQRGGLGFANGETCPPPMEAIGDKVIGGKGPQEWWNKLLECYFHYLSSLFP